MTPYLPWRDRIRLAWAILRAKVWIAQVDSTGWGQAIALRTHEDIEIIEGA
jgi:hypothetical protein